MSWATSRPNTLFFLPLFNAGSSIDGPVLIGGDDHNRIILPFIFLLPIIEPIPFPPDILHTEPKVYPMALTRNYIVEKIYSDLELTKKQSFNAVGSVRTDMIRP
jgi:hypothetical protein